MVQWRDFSFEFLLQGGDYAVQVFQRLVTLKQVEAGECGYASQRVAGIGVSMEKRFAVLWHAEEGFVDRIGS